MRWLLPFALLGALGCKQTDTEVQIGQLVTGVSVGGRHVCAIVSGGTIRCFGDGSAGQLGDGVDRGDAGSTDAGAETGVPLGVVGLTSASGIAAGFSHTCARLEGSAIRCWGANDFGQLGDGTTIAKRTPTILSLANVKEISAGGAHTCAVLNDGTAMCWGRNDDGQIGDGTTNTRLLPVAVNNLNGVEQIAAGMFHTCARLKSGAVHCWGRNDGGQIGDGTIGTQRLFAVPVLSLNDANDIAAGLGDTCAVTKSGLLRCWGRAIARANATTVAGFPALEEVSIATSVLEVCGRARDNSVRCTAVLGGTPRPINGILDAVQLSAGGFGTCARSSNGALRCWTAGSNPSAVLF